MVDKKQENTTEILAAKLREAMVGNVIIDLRFPGTTYNMECLLHVFPCLKLDSTETHDFTLEGYKLELKKNKFNARSKTLGGFHADLHKMKNIGDDEFLLLLGVDKNWAPIWIGLAPLKRIRDELLVSGNPIDYKNGWTQEVIDWMYEAKKKHPCHQTKAGAYTIRRFWDDHSDDPDFQVIWKA